MTRCSRSRPSPRSPRSFPRDPPRPTSRPSTSTSPSTPCPGHLGFRQRQGANRAAGAARADGVRGIRGAHHREERDGTLGTLISLAARDAGTFDASANTGGLNGSIRFELDGPENKRFLNAIEQLADAKKEIDAKCSQPIGWADLIALAPAGKARYAFLRDFCGYTDGFEPRWQYKAGDITKIGCDVEGVMLRAPYGSSPEQIEATSWFRQNYASTGPLTGARVHMGRADATAADQAGLVPTEGATAGEYIEWFARMRLSLPALVNLAPYVDDTCEATLRACPDCAGTVPRARHQELPAR